MKTVVPADVMVIHRAEKPFDMSELRGRTSSDLGPATCVTVDTSSSCAPCISSC
jgi:hypothetical protein